MPDYEKIALKQTLKTPLIWVGTKGHKGDRYRSKRHYNHTCLVCGTKWQDEKYKPKHCKICASPNWNTLKVEVVINERIREHYKKVKAHYKYKSIGQIIASLLVRGLRDMEKEWEAKTKKQ